MSITMSADTLLRPLVCCRGSKGVKVLDGTQFTQVPNFKVEFSKTCRSIVWSIDGKYLAWTNGSVVQVANSSNWEIVAELKRPKTSGLQFSSKKKFLVTWEPYQVTKENPVNTPNLHIWDLDLKQVVKSYVQKSHTQWEPAWSADEKLLARNLNQELQVYEVDKMDAIAQRLASTKVSDFSISPGQAPHHFLCYVQGTKGQPSFAKMFRYPNLNPSGVIASKSFFQGDHVEMKWNKIGSSVLLMTSTDVDTSGASYYGKQTLHFLDTKGTSAMVLLSKEGPIYSVEWNPRGNEFCVVYGFMPAKATLFDLKCEPKFDFGTGPRNSAFYNPFGNLLILGGFGNIRGKIEIWDVQSLKLVTPMDAADTTYLQWSCDGQHFLTATTAPRLRIGNGFKIWHYSGSLIHEHNVEPPEELWETLWQPMSEGLYKEFKVSNKKVMGIKSTQPTVSKELYRPPGARMTTAILKCLEEREAPSKPRALPTLGEMPDKATKKAKPKKRNQKKIHDAVVSVKTDVAKTSFPSVGIINVPEVEVKLTGNEEIDIKLKYLKDKLDQIARLKAELAGGKKLELNQIEKITREEEYLIQLNKLTSD